MFNLPKFDYNYHEDKDYAIDIISRIAYKYNVKKIIGFFKLS